MLVIWLSSLAVIINQLRRKYYKISKQIFKHEDQIKRIGVYYMCIDDAIL